MKFIYSIFLISLGVFSELAATDTDFDRQLKKLRALADDTTKVVELTNFAFDYMNTYPRELQAVFNEITKLAAKFDFYPGLAKAYQGLGNTYYFLSEYPPALESWKKAEYYFLKTKNQKGQAAVISNSGAIYFNLGDLDEALKQYLRALKIAEEIKDTSRIGTVLVNIGSLHLDRKENELALKAYLRGLALFKAKGYSEGIGMALLNAGNIYYSQGDYNKANKFFLEAVPELMPTPYYATLLKHLGETQRELGAHKQGIFLMDSALRVATSTENGYEKATILYSLGVTYAKLKNIPLSMFYYEQAKNEALKLGNHNWPLEVAAKGLVELYQMTNNYEKAFENQKLVQMVQDSNSSVETERKFNTMLFKFEMDKKEVELEKKQTELKAKRNQQMGMGIGLFSLSVLAFVFFKQRNRIGKEKARSEALLLNILPEEIAAELKEKGHAEARDFDLASILFTDFKGFTQLSTQMTAASLVEEINHCFKAFDGIIDKYGIEKIKTIGDAYMAAGGLPVPFEAAVKNTALAALEMQAFIAKRKVENELKGLPAFEMRVGIHTGPVVAGIVGVKKFQYDIWGDTVNTASRMESSGEVGKVNISQATYELLKDDVDFTFESRGKLAAKGKGELEMWFIKLV